MKKDFEQMHSAAADIELMSDMTKSLERSEARRGNTTLTNARVTAARRLGITTTVFENYLYSRTKKVSGWLMEKVRRELISSLELEAQNLEHEIKLYRKIDGRVDGNALAKAEAQLVSVRKILLGEVT